MCLLPVYFLQDSDDLSSFVQSISLKAPYLLVTYSAEETNFHIVVEQEIIAEVSNYESALIHLLGTYFIFDIAYPKPLCALLLLLQHYILGLSDSQHDPPSVMEMVTSLKNMD